MFSRTAQKWHPRHRDCVPNSKRHISWHRELGRNWRQSCPTEAVKLGRSSDIVGFENSFTAKDQHDHLEVAIRNWPHGTEPEAEAEPDLVPIEPVSSVPANPTPAIDSEQSETWWTWAKANAAKKTIILKSVVALLAAIILGWMPLQRLVATTSAEAVINARVIIIRTPIEGEVSAAPTNLEIGKELSRGI